MVSRLSPESHPIQTGLHNVCRRNVQGARSDPVQSGCSAKLPLCNKHSAERTVRGSLYYSMDDLLFQRIQLCSAPSYTLNTQSALDAMSLPVPWLSFPQWSFDRLHSDPSVLSWRQSSAGQRSGLPAAHQLSQSLLNLKVAFLVRCYWFLVVMVHLFFSKTAPLEADFPCVLPPAVLDSKDLPGLSLVLQLEIHFFVLHPKNLGERCTHFEGFWHFWRVHWNCLRIIYFLNLMGLKPALPAINPSQWFGLNRKDLCLQLSIHTSFSFGNLFLWFFIQTMPLR